MALRNIRLLCRGFLQKMVNEGKLTLAPAFIAADSIHHELGEEMPSEYRSGPDAMADFVKLYRRAFPDLRLKIEDEVVEGNRMVTRFRLEGTQTGPLMGIAASGRRVSVEGIRIDKVEKGKIAESWMHWDTLLLLEQIGALPKLNRQPARVSVPFEGTVRQSSCAPALAA